MEWNEPEPFEGFKEGLRERLMPHVCRALVKSGITPVYMPSNLLPNYLSFRNAINSGNIDMVGIARDLYAEAVANHYFPRHLD